MSNLKNVRALLQVTVCNQWYAFEEVNLWSFAVLLVDSNFFFH